jgi:signal transduction histidine kinase
VFRLLRYFSVASLAAVAAIVTALHFVMQEQEHDEIVSLGETLNLPISRTIGNAIWPRHAAFFERALDLDDAELRAAPEIAAIDREVRNMMRGIPALKVKFFGTNRRTLYSSDPREIGRSYRSSPPLDAALVGRSASRLRESHTLLTLEGHEITTMTIGSHVPVYSEAGAVLGSVEVYADVSALVERAEEEVLESTIKFAAALVLLYAALYLVVVHGDRLLRRQYAALAASEGRERARNAVLQREIAQRQEAERKIDALSEVEATNRAMNSMIANMSHELRTPLNAIIGFSEMIEHRMLGAEALDRYANYAGDIHRSADHLLAIINNVLDLAKLQAGKMELHEEEVAVAEAVDDAVSMIKPLAAIKRQTIEISITGSLQMVGDLRQLRQMLLNLLSNAVKFTPDGGDITVAAMLDERRGLEITVADSGIGIPRKDLARALTPFVQVDDHMTRRFQGTGLGLSIVKSLVELHGGRFTLDSIVGIGTTATLHFPAERVVLQSSVAVAA